MEIVGLPQIMAVTLIMLYEARPAAREVADGDVAVDLGHRLGIRRKASDETIARRASSRVG